MQGTTIADGCRAACGTYSRAVTRTVESSNSRFGFKQGRHNERTKLLAESVDRSGSGSQLADEHHFQFGDPFVQQRQVDVWTQRTGFLFGDQNRLPQLAREFGRFTRCSEQ